MKTIIRSIAFLVLFFQYANSYSQHSKDHSFNEVLMHFDSLYGADNLLINGRIFMYPNIRAKGDPFFYGKDTKLCELYIKNRKFSNLVVNYNIAEDKLILISEINNNNLSIELNNQLIDSFFISHYAINQNYQNPSSFSSGNPETYRLSKKLLFKKKFVTLKNHAYYECIYSRNDQLLKKYFKNFSDKVTEEYKHGSFTDQKTLLYICRNDEIIEVGNKTKFIKAFIIHKKEIKKFLKENKIKYKTADNKELIKLMTFCENLYY